VERKMYFCKRENRKRRRLEKEEKVEERRKILILKETHKGRISDKRKKERRQKLQ
jgi:hypothetical protein